MFWHGDLDNLPRVDGHTYGFYSVVTDSNGIGQPSPAAAQASTTVDAVSLTGSVSPLPGFSGATITLNWSGSDPAGGSGLAAFDIYFSDNGGAFAPLLTVTTLVSKTYAGQDGHTYGFYAQAIDKVGDRQAAPESAQASTLVDIVPPYSTAASLLAFGKATLILDRAGSDAASGLATYDIYVSDNAGPFTAFLIATTLTADLRRAARPQNPSRRLGPVHCPG